MKIKVKLTGGPAHGHIVDVPDGCGSVNVPILANSRMPRQQLSEAAAIAERCGRSWRQALTRAKYKRTDVTRDGYSVFRFYDGYYDMRDFICDTID